MTDRTRITEAVNYLIAAPNYSQLVSEITKIIEHWDTHPMTYTGHLSTLNSLVDVGLADREAFERVVKLVENRRKQLPGNRVDYQRDFMNEKRVRQAKAAELHELRHGKFANATARRAYLTDQHNRWIEARDEYVAAKGDLSWAERNAAKSDFWQAIDENLDRALAEAKGKR